MQCPQNFGDIHTDRHFLKMVKSCSISKHVNPLKTGSPKFSQIQHFLLMYVEESKKPNNAQLQEKAHQSKQIYVYLLETF